jgi:hypothetical protein
MDGSGCACFHPSLAGGTGGRSVFVFSAANLFACLAARLRAVSQDCAVAKG